MAMTIQELREKRKKVWDTARDFLDSKRNANGVLSEEDSKTYDAMEQTIIDLGKEIQRLERQAEIEAEMNKATSTPVLGKPATPNVTEKTGTASDTYKKAFWNSIRNRNWIDVHDDLHIGTDAEGGYLVPDVDGKVLISSSAPACASFPNRLPPVSSGDNGITIFEIISPVSRPSPICMIVTPDSFSPSITAC